MVNYTSAEILKQQWVFISSLRVWSIVKELCNVTCAELLFLPQKPACEETRARSPAYSIHCIDTAPCYTIHLVHGVQRERMA